MTDSDYTAGMPAAGSLVDRIANLAVTVVPLALIAVAIWQSWGGLLVWQDILIFFATLIPFGFGITVVVLVSASALVFGVSSWRVFFARVTHHSDVYYVMHVGLKKVLTFRNWVRSQNFHGHVGLENFRVWNLRLRETWASMWWITIPVRALEPDDGYTRERFGQAWADVDGNGCDTRNDVLARDLADARLDPGGCLVLAGTLDDPYTGTVIAFVRGPDSATVQIDHLVALDDAWRTGARSWPAARRLGFANDPANLIAVSGDANQDKGAADASGWLPPQAGFACVYVARQLRVKAAYGLWLTPDEHAAADRALRGCAVVR